MLAKSLFDLPETVRKNDFVAMLTTNVAHPAETAASFVVTPQIAQSFDRALTLVGSALADGRSVGAYLHGSFGSGKSHFMAMLSLLLRGEAHAWAKPELHDLRPKHAYVGKKALLELHLHMIGKRSLEAAVFGGYLAQVTALHPDAPIPAAFSDGPLFDNAAAVLDTLGEEAFFKKLGVAPSGTDDGWGELATDWDGARFEAARTSADPAVRAELFDLLVKSELFSAYRKESAAFVEFDEGLAVLSRHAKSLGYDGIVLFLDEVILWLAHRASEYAWMHNEVQKMVKLVEAQSTDRPVPIVSFLARQRNLAELVGDQYAGAETENLWRSLQHWENRFDTIALEDKNLATIVEKRILRTKDKETPALIDKTLADMRSRSGAAFDTLLGSYDADTFRKLYPFSPAVIDALVGLSQSLQRERTSLRLVTEILVEHIEELELGEIIRVGDLFDVLAGGEEPADGLMRARFASAKRLYRHDLLPVIRERNKTISPEKCQRDRPTHQERLGCSNCLERTCRMENRLVKTLLIAALVPNVTVLKGLTVSRLVSLNHGSVKSIVPGNESQKAATVLRELAKEFGQIRIGDQQDPTVAVGLEGIDLKPILDQAREKDQSGARQKLVRDLLLEAMERDVSRDVTQKIEHEWRHTRRRGEVRFANVRKLRPEDFEHGDGDAFRVIVDYPFDESGHGPSEDIAIIERFMETGSGAYTLVWLPSFFAKSVNDTVGDLVVLDHIMESADTKNRYLGHLSVEDRQRALSDLESLRLQKRAYVLMALEQAYGLRHDRTELLDSGMTVEKPLWLLKPGATFTPRAVPDLGGALSSYLDALLEARWPRHPLFERRITPGEAEKLVLEFRAILESDVKHIVVDRERHEKLRGTLGALGLVRASEGKVHLYEEGLLARIEQKRVQAGAQRPTAAEVRGYTDEGGKMGLDDAAEDLIVRCYAAWAARTFVLDGRPFEPKAGQRIPEHVELDKPDLPTQDAWQRALTLAASVYGLTFSGRALHADNLKRFESELLAKLDDRAVSAVRALPNALARRADALGVTVEDARVRTAASGATFAVTMRALSGRALVDAMAEFQPETSAKALGASLRTAAPLGQLLEDDLVFGVFAQLAARRDVLVGASEVLEGLAQTARQDELLAELGKALRAFAEKGQRLLAESAAPAPTKVEPPKPAPPGTTSRKLPLRTPHTRNEALAAFDAYVADVRATIASSEGPVWVEGELVLVQTEPAKGDA